MMPRRERQEHLFILRVWRDGSAADAWRGSLTDVRSKDIRYFKNPQSIQGFINTVVEESTAAALEQDEEDE